MAKQRGRFITLEGGEGTGKSTLQAALSTRLQALGLTVITTREPGGTPLAEEIRALVLNPPKGASWSPMAEALLMNAARSDHLDKLIRPALARGDWVVCDRFSDSTRVYQRVGAGVGEDVLLSMEANVLGNDTPDITFVLDAPLDITAQRRTARANANGHTASDAFERRGVAFHEAVRQGFLNLIASEPGRCKRINAADEPEQVIATALTHLAPFLPNVSAETTT